MQRPEIFLININSTFPYPNLGIASLSAYLKERGVAVRQADLTLPPIEGITRVALLQKKHRLLFQEMTDFISDVKLTDTFSDKHRKLKMVLMLWTQYLLRENPHSLGFSINTYNVGLTLLLCQIIKMQRPDLPVIFGGPECNVYTGKIFLKMKYADIIVEGEGEESLYQVLRGLRKRKPVSIPCTISPEERQTSYITGATPLCIDDLPPPDYEDIFKKKYPPTTLPVAFNRGCSFRCSFCNEREYWKAFRQLQVSNAVAYLVKLKQQYGVNRFFLCQSLMNNDIGWLRDFAVQLDQSKTEVLWGGNARIHGKMDKDYFTTLYQGGCRFFHWGIESGSKSVLKSMQKGSTPQINSRVLQDAASSGLWNHTYWIFGFPTESEADLLESVDFILNNAKLIHSAFFHIYTVSGVPNNEEVSRLDVIDYYHILTTAKRSEISPLVGKFAKFFKNITNIMNTSNNLDKKFEAPCKKPNAVEEKIQMLAATHLLRFFITETEARDELVGLLTQERFQEAFGQLILSQRPTLEEMMIPDRPFGEALFHALQHQAESRL